MMGTTLEQFLNSRRDLDQHRTGADVFPDKEQSAEIERRALAAGIQASAIRDVFEAYSGNPKAGRKPEFDLVDMDIWLERQKIERPHLFPTAGIFALATEAFCGELNLTARARLVNELGSEVQADLLAKQFGLSGLNDYKTRGVVPDPANQTLAAETAKLEAEIAERQAKLAQVRKAAPQPGKSSTNPFDRLTGEALAKWLEGAVKAMGTAKVAAIAAAAHPPRRLDGSPIPGRFR